MLWPVGWGVFGCVISSCLLCFSVFVCLCVLCDQGRTVDALACWADEGRARLRYASGSCQRSVDPRMSEWGNPAPVVWCDLQVNA